MDITSLQSWCNIDFYEEFSNPLYYARNLYLNGSKLEHLDLTGLELSSVCSYSFINSSATALTLPVGIQEIGRRAFYMSQIQDLTMPAGLMYIGNCAFSESALQSVTFPENEVMVSYGAFAWCRDLKQIDFGSVQSSISNGAFAACGLESVTIPAQMTWVGYSVFDGCSELTDVTFEGENVEIGNYAFYGCPIEHLDLDGIVSIEEYAFSEGSFAHVKIPEAVTQLTYESFGWNENLQSVVIPNTVESIDYAFQGSDNVNHVIYTGSEEQWNNIEWYGEKFAETATYHFNATGNEVTMEETATHYNYSCSLCDFTASVEKRHPQIDTNIVDSGVCGDNLTWTLDKDGVLTISGVGAMYDWDRDAPWFAEHREVIQAIVIEDGVTTIGDTAFDSCGLVTSLEIPDSVTSIGDEAFQGCYSLESIQIPAGVTEIGQFAFAHCKKLTSMKIPNGVTAIGQYAFNACENLQSVEIPDSVTTIGKSAFFACEKLNNVEIPESVITIGEYAFCFCNSLTDVYYDGSQKQWNNIAIGEGNEYLLNATIHYGQVDPVVIIQQPQDAHVPAGQTVTMTVVAEGEGLSYRWYYKNANATSFTASSNKTDTYTAKMTAAMDGRQVYCLVTDQYGQTVQSEIATITLHVHSFTNYISNGDATCTENGTETAKCDSCEETKTRTVAGSALGHNYVEGTCDRCGDVSVALEILQQPQDTLVPKNTTASVTVVASGDGLTYKWYYKNASASAYTASTNKTNTYSVKMSAAVNGRQVYCVITDKYGKTVQTEVATLSLQETVKITQQPKDMVVAKGVTAFATVVAEGEGMTYRWYYKNPNGTSFAASSNQTDTYSVKMSDAINGRQVYCIITDQYSQSVQSNTVTLAMKEALVVTQQPQDVVSVKGVATTVTFTATGEGLTYRWYYKNPNETEFKASSNQTDAYSITMSDAVNGRQIYCQITDQYGEVIRTNTVTLTMAETVKIVQQPTDTTVAKGAKASVTVVAEGEGMTYRWYYKNANATSFTASSNRTDTYTATMSDVVDGRQVYCVVTDRYNKSVKSAVATLWLDAHRHSYTNYISDNNATCTENGTETAKCDGCNETDTRIVAGSAMGHNVVDGICTNCGEAVAILTIIQQPQTVEATIGEKIAITVVAEGDEVTYQWYFKNANGISFSASSNKTDTYTATMSSTLNGRQVYCVVTDRHGVQLTTQIATIFLPGGLKITQQPQDVAAATGEEVVLTVVAEGEGLSYQWYFKNADATSFSASSNKTDTYTATMGAALDGRQVYCQITDQYGRIIKTEIATLWLNDHHHSFTNYISNGDATCVEDGTETAKCDTCEEFDTRTAVGSATGHIMVNGACSQCGARVALNILQQPSSVEVASGKKVTITVEAEGEGLTYQWYYKNANATSYTASSNKTAAYSATVSQTVNGRQVYCVITDQYGAQVVTEKATISMEGAMKITQQIQDAEAASGEKVTLVVGAEGQGLTYQWYFKNANATSFTASSNKTNTYTATMSSTLNGRQVYCVVTDQNGNVIITDISTLILK